MGPWPGDGYRQVIEYAEPVLEEIRESVADGFASSGGDPEPSRRVPPGWCHSHTRSEAALTGADLELHERYFPELWHVAIIVRPEAGDPRVRGSL